MVFKFKKGDRVRMLTTAIELARTDLMRSKLRWLSLERKTLTVSAHMDASYGYDQPRDYRYELKFVDDKGHTKRVGKMIPEAMLVPAGNVVTLEVDDEAR